MKLAAIIFFGLLIYAHQACGLDQPLYQPLCDFREGDLGVLGYALFCAIALVGALYTFDLKRLEDPSEAMNTLGFGVLLLIVVATPSGWPLHDASAIVLLTSIHIYFAVVLYRAGHPLLMMIHLSVPLVLGIATGFQSYGIWQKGMISYFIIAAVVHHDLLKRGARARAQAVGGYAAMESSLLSLLVLAIMCCGAQPTPSIATNSGPDSSHLIVPGDRVGTYLVNVSTLPEILGTDSAESRRQFADDGLYFEFEQGRELKAITVETSHFQLANGLKVGSTIEDVEARMGKPDTRRIAGEKIELNAIMYQGVTFFPKDGAVMAIRVASPSQ